MTAMVGPVAEPTRTSMARLTEDGSRWLGYQEVGVCAHCVRTVVILPGGTTWIHHRSGDAACPTR